MLTCYIDMENNFQFPIQELIAIFEMNPLVKLVYFFGSKAVDKQGPMSDFDFAVYLDENDKNKILDNRLSLMDKLSRLLKTDKIDVVMLNTTQSPELKYNIISQGKLIYEKQPFRVMVEPKILNEYFDFHYSISKYNLTKA